jgi:aquaporin TIP
MPATLKICFLYCSVFPKGSDIDKDLLIQQWIALGFIQLNGSSQPEGCGEDYVFQLLGMSFLQISTSQTPVSHFIGFYRSFLVSFCSISNTR